MKPSEWLCVLWRGRSSRLQTLHVAVQRPIVRHWVLLLIVAVAGVAELSLQPEAAQADPQTNCPAGSLGDKPFAMANLSKCVFVNTDHHKKPKAHQTVDYNIYCPGRIPANDGLRQAREIGKKIVAGDLISDSERSGVNPVITQHNQARMKATFIDTPHVFHYGCHAGGGTGVATHIKVRVKATPLSPPPPGEQCVAFGSQNGAIEKNARMDREYRCNNPMIHATQRGGFGSDVKAIANALLKTPPKVAPTQETDFAKAQKNGLKICLLEATDIQCRPCTWSDKLIVRVKTIPKNQACPANSREVR